ncbi:carotenoid oxygenase [Sordaria brevicollis]|uniref:Carotenoid oxygenase n=1 Tax=Sordaria brevicollis TaxID=83679 RepID=A0AAE0NVZ3_SORBR|nr:carotenoid oxygenase [Sordaria brevicollis]
MSSKPYTTVPIASPPSSQPPYDKNGRLTSPHPIRFPPTPVFTGFNTPLRATHLSLPHLPISGQIPPGLDGTFYRVQPDRFFPPLYENDIHFNGDGAVTAISLHGPPLSSSNEEDNTASPPDKANPSSAQEPQGQTHEVPPATGTASLLHKYVLTTRLTLEQSHSRALFGSYRNQYTDHPFVQDLARTTPGGIDRTVANTNVVFWRGQLLAMKEDGLPVALDPETLETRTRGWDFDGQLGNRNFTAHPKLVPKRRAARRDAGTRTGAGFEGNAERDQEGKQEMVCFAYEAGPHPGLCTVDCVVWTIDEDTGLKLAERWFKAPFAGMIHDCGVSENYVVLPLTPLKMDLERMKRGGEKFAWDPEEDQWYGVVPRDNKEGEVVWFRADNGFHGHVAGCYELPTGEVVIDLTVADNNVFYWFPPDPKITPSAPPLDPKIPLRPNKLTSPTMRWIINPHAARSEFVTSQGDTILVADERLTPAVVWPTNGEFSRIDERYITKPYRHFWQAVVDPTKPYDFEKCGPPAGGLFNCLGHFTWGDEHFHSPSSSSGPSSSVTAPQSAPAPAPYGRSYATAPTASRSGPTSSGSDPPASASGSNPGTSTSTSSPSPSSQFGSEDIYHASPTTIFQEPTFIPSPHPHSSSSSNVEGQGYIIALLNHLDQLRNDVVIFDALNLRQGPVAVIHLPMKLKLGLHGNWVERREVEGWRRRLELEGAVEGKTEGQEDEGAKEAREGGKAKPW